MAANSKIEWTDASWNPIVGCSLASPGCTNCYAMKQAARIVRMAPIGEDSDVPQTHYLGTTKTVNLKPVWTGKVVLAPDHIVTAPLRWKKPRRIFVNSMGDLFHESVPVEWIDRVFVVMALCPQHTFQVLTKRSARMRAYCSGRFGGEFNEHISSASLELNNSVSSEQEMQDAADWTDLGKPLPNVWLGVSTEDQRRADERIPDLLATPAAVRFVSAEPLLGPIDLTKHFFNPLEFARQLHLVIVGGESGPGARPMHPDWARSIRDQCAAAGVPFFFKQWGAWAPDTRPQDDRDAIIDGRARCAMWTGASWGYFASGYDTPMSGISKDDDYVYRLGKKRAGRLLDGVEHNGMPEVRP